MKLKEIKPLVIAAWDDWTASRSLRCDNATGRDTLQFYYELQDTQSSLLHFVSRKREKWQVIHEWIESERRVGL
jgi:hypothetical protein